MPQTDSKVGAGKLRIIAGRLRGSRLVVPEVEELRPSSDRVRETLFNWLAPVIEGACCLDLFAGTGALGIEAWSRGATDVLFVERDLVLAQMLEANLARLNVSEGQVYRQDALAYLANYSAVSDTKAFDIVFLDPPFKANLWKQAAQLLEERGWLKPQAWIYVETPRGCLPDMPDSWVLYRQGRAGEVRYVLYRRDTSLR